MNKEIEQKTGIPLTGSDAEKCEFATQLLFRFDMTCCKLLEKGVEYLPFDVSLDGFTETFDESPQLQAEVKGCFREWIQDPENKWVAECSGPGIRLAMAHFYAIAQCLKKRGKPKKEFPADLSLNGKVALAQAGFKSVISPYPRINKGQSPKPPTVPSVLRV
jgi:hypothetical protein